MRKLFLTIALLVMSAAAMAQQTVYEETAYNNQNQLFIRLVNYSPNWVACYYKDDFNYYTFQIAPQTITQWQPVYGVYAWECRYY
jgi:hypothetical protein